MRTRPNAEYHTASSWGKPNDLYRRFKKAFDAIVAVENPAIARHEFGDWFVPTPVIEEILRESCAGELDSMRFLLGSTGVGKSTLLRYVFRTANAPMIEGESLLIPFCFNGRWPETDVFNPMAAAASRRLTEQFSLTFDLEEFYFFVSANRPDLLELDPQLSESASKQERLLALKRIYLVAYELEKLKFLLAKTTLVRVILIVDDVESVPFDIQASLIGDICKAYAFLQNQPMRRFGVKCVLSCRPSTHSLLRKVPWYTAYAFDEPIYINTVVDLEKLFTARFQSAIKKTSAGQDIRNKPEWDRAYEILLKIVRQLSTKYEVALTSLCNNNVRRALTEFQQLLTNRKWFQRDKVVSPAFTIHEADYAVNEAAVYRALALHNGDVYPARDSIIANLLHNTPDEGSDLLVTYIIRYLLNQKSPGEEPGHSQIQKSILCADLTLLFHEITGAEQIDAGLKYMLDSKLLEGESVKNQEILTLTPKAETLWKMLQSNSICLAFFRDDTYQEATNLMPLAGAEHHHPDQAFLSVIAFLDVIVAAEKKRVLNAVRNRLLRAYISRFGEQTLGRYLVGGIHHSIGRFYFKGGPPELVTDALETSRAKVAEVESLLRDTV